jgi:hypothetical protein
MLLNDSAITIGVENRERRQGALLYFLSPFSKAYLLQLLWSLLSEDPIYIPQLREYMIYRSQEQ